MGGDTSMAFRGPSTYPKKASDPIPVMKHVQSIYEGRLETFIGQGQYAGSNLRSKLHEATASGSPHVELSVYSAHELSRPTFKNAVCRHFKPTKVGESFGPSWSTHWFKVELIVPTSLQKKQHLEFHWNANNEGLIWTEDGDPIQGLTGGGDREEWILPDSYRDGKTHTFYIEMACNGMFGNATSDTIQPPDPNRYFQLQKADIVAVNLGARALFMDFWILKDAAKEFNGDSWQRHEALTVANEVVDCFTTEGGTDECLKECRKIAARYLGDKVDSADVYDTDTDVLVNAVGNCHIDTCWLWPWAETKRKIARSWANQCDLIERYPEYVFACSQAQQYKWLKTYYPSLYDRVKTKVKEGRFQPIGGSWVEHDTNMPSGESLVRQFLYGQRFFESHFGERSKTFWLPDTFGYSSQLPQLCRSAGMSRFFTQKLSWNNINTYPHTTFNWVSLDGSQVLCHMAPCETYTAEADFGDVKRSMTQHKSMNQDATSILPYGKGDGGGGPTWQHIEKLRRCRGISDKVGQLPRVKVGNSVDDFFARLEKKAAQGTDYVSWHGELYLELHRGTYTTQANNKRNNRFAERMLHDIEFLSTFATIKDKKFEYPKFELDSMWEDVLLCQFHDCLPGSSIEMCYRDSDNLYAKVFKTGEKLLDEAMSALGFKDARDPRPEDFAINVLPFSRSLGVRSFSTKACNISAPTTGDGVYELSNDMVEVTVANGLITSYYDKRAERELIPAGQKGNQLVLFDDKPLYWQAWDVEVFHLNSRVELTPHSTTITTATPHTVSVTSTTKISEHSTISTTLSLTAGSPLLTFSSTVDWHETQKFLKVEFPTSLVSNTGTASYETQYGIINRPIHYNTTWDMAKFEVCCHRWADLSESNYGVSILNDCKYGFAVAGSTMRLSLLRAPKAPDAHADMGTHHFRYGMLPHTGPVGAETVRAATEFNNPMESPEYPPSKPSASSSTNDGDCTIAPVSSNSHSRPPLFPHTSLTSYRRPHAFPHDIKALLTSLRLAPGSDPGIVVDCIKRGEDDEDVRANAGGDDANDASLPVRKGRSVIVRVYDALGGRARGWLDFGVVAVERVDACNVLEDDVEGEKIEIACLDEEEGIGGWPGPAASTGEKKKGFRIVLGAFEVKTYRLTLA